MADRRKTYTDEQKREALHMYEEEGPSAVQKNLGIPKNTVVRWAKTAGVRTVRNPKTEAATQAAAVDAASIRQGVASKSISAADKAVSAILDRLDTEAHDLPLKDLATVLGILTDKHAAIVRMDAGTENHNAVDAWLDHILGPSPGRIETQERPPEAATPEGLPTTD